MTNELKWCRCDEPNFMKLPSSINMLNPFCLTCGNEWRKWKNIRGSELLDYPMTTDDEDGTPFHLTSWDGDKYIYLMREDDEIVIMLAKKEEDGLYYHNPLPKNEIAEILLQDRFEIVEDVE